MVMIRRAQMEEIGDAEPNKPVVQACPSDPHWIELELVDQDGDPVPDEPFSVRLPDQSLRTGTTDKEGKVRFEGITAGQATICFTAFDSKEWQPC